MESWEGSRIPLNQFQRGTPLLRGSPHMLLDPEIIWMELTLKDCAKHI